jgi:hypothetical protein
LTIEQQLADFFVSINGKSFRLKDERQAGLLCKTAKQH